ncbi:MAG: efflux RND transporter periplasmic adaptor subunit [Bacteroidota bacterium]
MSIQKLVLPIVLLLVALGGYYFYTSQSEEEQESDVTAVAQKKEFTVKVDATGELEAKRSVKISAPSGMRNNRIYQTTIQNMVPEGTVVKEGDFVATLDRTEIANKMGDAQTEVDKILTQLEQAKIDTAITLRGLRDEMINIDFSKKEKLLEIEQNKYEPQAVRQQKDIDLTKLERDLRQLKSKYKLEQDKATAKIAEITTSLKQNNAKLARLSKLSADFTIKAPKSGMIIYARNWNGKVKSGSQIQAWDPTVAELPDLSEMISKTYVNEIDISRIHVGQKVNIRIDAFPDNDFPGIVKTVANVGEELREYDAKVFEVNIDLLNIDSVMRPAMTTSNEIIAAVLTDVISVPLEALYSDSLPYVFKEIDGRIIKQEVITGPTNNDQVVIDFGLEAGDTYYLSKPDGANSLAFYPVDTAIRTRVKQEQQARDQAQKAKAAANLPPDDPVAPLSVNMDNAQ